MDWRDYEDEVAAILVERVGGQAEVEKDARLPGRFSGGDRQIDILVKGRFAGLADATLVVDCKCFSKNVDVKDVEEFIGLVNDVRATMGMLITTQGYSEKARERARAERGVHTEVMGLEELARWEPPLLSCEACKLSRDPEKMPGMLWLDLKADIEVEGYEEDKVVDVETITFGACEICGTIHVECPDCGSVVALDEIHEWQPCDGCDVNWYLTPYHPKEGDSVEERVRMTRGDSART